ncbi:MAG: putative RNA methyltransferase [Turicibacter sp.]
MSNQVLCCPVCQSTFQKVEKQYLCENRHSFDCAKEGYVNLLLAHQKSSKDPGDSKEMMVARQRFLTRGYYEKLSDEIISMINKYVYLPDQDIQVLDAGSGEGYYVDRLQHRFKDDNNIHFTGLDISKEGVRLGAKRNKHIQFAVSSVFEMPIASQSLDGLFSVFAPLAEKEFVRVLKENGKLIVVSPGAHHLFGLKEKLYESPYLNEEDKINFEQFKLIEKTRVRYEIEIDNKEDLHALMLMTPYYWKTSAKQLQDLLETVHHLKTSIEFIVACYQKSNE